MAAPGDAAIAAGLWGGRTSGPPSALMSPRQVGDRLDAWLAGPHVVPARAAYVDAIAEATSDPSGQTSEDDARCTAEVFVEAVGVEQLGDATSPDEIRAAEDFDTASLGLELDDARGDAFYEGLQGCSPDLKHEIVLSMVTPLGLSDAAVTCVEEGLTDDVARDLTVSIFTQGADANQDPALVSALQTVITPCQTANSPSP